MKLFVRSATLREVIRDQDRFPTRLRQLICEAVADIDAEELEGLLAKHEADPGNFDGTVEANLRRLGPSLVVKANCRISDSTKFDNDIVIEADDALVCLEIEKGNTSRFEFDILKMQAFASRWKCELPGKPIFGAFVVPADNVVARHISGNARESSYRYLTRLFRLVGQIQPLHIEDILVVGYAMEMPQDEVGRNKRPKAPSGLLVQENGLLPEEALKAGLHGYPTDLIFYLRGRLAECCPTLRENFNPNARYLGYGLVGGSYDLFVYVRKNGLLIDIRLPVDRVEDLRSQGFDVRPRNNYQAKAGWLTGLFVPHDTDKRELLVALAMEAIQGE